MTVPTNDREPTPTRRLPQPVLSLLLLAAWVLAANRISIGVVLMGALLAALIPWITARYWPEAPAHVRWRPLLRLAAVLLKDIVVANVRVARQILGPTHRLRPGFFDVPLDTQEPFTIAALASVVSLTPGSMTAAVSEDQRRLLIHALHIEDVTYEIARIKQRYERPLQEIFE